MNCLSLTANCSRKVFMQYSNLINALAGVRHHSFLSSFAFCGTLFCVHISLYLRVYTIRANDFFSTEYMIFRFHFYFLFFDKLIGRECFWQSIHRFHHRGIEITLATKVNKKKTKQRENFHKIGFEKSKTLFFFLNLA